MKVVQAVKFHATTLNQPVHIYPMDVVGVTFLEKNQSVALLMVGGSAIPVAGTLDEVVSTITAAKQAALNQAPDSAKETN